MVVELPKILHFVWVGNDERRPAHIRDWEREHKRRGWSVNIWDNISAYTHDWPYKQHILTLMNSGEMPGAADLLRYAVLKQYGGIYIDADTAFENPLDDLRILRAWTVWEQGVGGLIANGFIGLPPEHPVLRDVIAEIMRRRHPLEIDSVRCRAWEATGPKLWTRHVLNYNADCSPDGPDTPITILPSRTFIGSHYTEFDPVARGLYGTHEWRTTLQA